MDNLRNVIELLFLDRDVKEVLDTLNDDREESEVVPNKVFKNLFLSKYRRYSGNQLNSLFDITNDDWTIKLISQDKIIKTVFNLLYSLTEKVLTRCKGKPICKYDNYLRWHKATEPIGEDILVTNYMAFKDCKQKQLRKKNKYFLGYPYLLTNKKELSPIFANGLSELHSHLKGSSLIFTLNWLAVMNHPKACTYELFKDITNMENAYQKMMMAAFIRAILFKCVNSIENEVFEEKVLEWLNLNDKLEIDGDRVSSLENFAELMRIDYGDELDYAIPKHLAENIKNKCDSRKCLVGERKLLYLCFSKVYRNETSQTFNTLFYVYLIIKSQFRLAMIQINSVIGFENFQYYDEKKSIFLKSLENNDVYKNALIEIGVKLPIQQTNVNYIEYRIAPGDTVAELQDTINKANSYLSKQNKCCYIVHFIKKSEDDADFACRNYNVRGEIETQANNLIAYKVECDALKEECLIKGIDAANSEFYCRPEVFGPVFRKLRDKGFKITYHVGEDFYDIVDGLRAIDEAMIFLNLQKGDRIGHGTALGLDVNKYYGGIFRTVVMPKQVLLDNVAWLLYKIDECHLYCSCDCELYNFLKKQYDELYKEIFEETYGVVTLHTYHNFWLLRGDDPNVYETEMIEDEFQLNNAEEVRNARTDNLACTVYHTYHYDSDVKERGNESMECKIDKKYIHSFVRVLSKIQEKMQREVAEKGIHIECNPTSNLRIGNIEKYSEHPIVKFHGKGLTLCKSICCKPNISVSINTDDAGIFATSLEKEYTLMAVALSKEVDEKGHKKYSERRIMKWLDNIRQEAIKHQFLK